MFDIVGCWSRKGVKLGLDGYSRALQWVYASCVLSLVAVVDGLEWLGPRDKQTIGHTAGPFVLLDHCPCTLNQPDVCHRLSFYCPHSLAHHGQRRTVAFDFRWKAPLSVAIRSPWNQALHRPVATDSIDSCGHVPALGAETRKPPQIVPFGEPGKSASGSSRSRTLWNIEPPKNQDDLCTQLRSGSAALARLYKVAPSRSNSPQAFLWNPYPYHIF